MTSDKSTDMEIQQEKKSSLRVFLQVVFSIAVIVICGRAFYQDNFGDTGLLSEPAGTSDSVMARQIYSIDPHEAVRLVPKFAVGAWTYTEPYKNGCVLECWVRYQIAADGTAVAQDGAPADDHWGGTANRTASSNDLEKRYGWRAYVWLADSLPR